MNACRWLDPLKCSLATMLGKDEMQCDNGVKFTQDIVAGKTVLSIGDLSSCPLTCCIDLNTVTYQWC